MGQSILRVRPVADTQRGDRFATTQELAQRFRALGGLLLGLLPADRAARARPARHPDHRRDNLTVKQLDQFSVIRAGS